MIKTHMNEMDHRSTPLRTLCTTASNAIEELATFSKAGLFDGLTAMEYASYFQGAVLVACQAYAVGTVKDINIIRKSQGMEPIKKHILYKSNNINTLEFSYVELINALANYFKHNEEWSSWPKNITTKTLGYFNIIESTEFPMNFGITKIIGESSNLRGLCEVLETWRNSEIRKLKSTIKA